MILSFLLKRNLLKYQSLVSKINKLESNTYSDLPLDQISKKLLEIKDSTLKAKEKTLHAMALAKKASTHVLGMSYYDVQLMGALALVDGNLAEMKTGEGKTLTCSAAVASNFVLGFKTHVATANEYLASRDEESLRKLYSFLGITSSCSVSTMNHSDKQKAYQADVLYSTAQELGFDLLRDNLVTDVSQKIQPTDFSKVKAIIDEADFILIDEARTPLIISGQANGHTEETYQLLQKIASKLTRMREQPSEDYFAKQAYIPGDFWVDEKYKTVHLSDEGYSRLNELAVKFNLLAKQKQGINSTVYSEENSWVIHDILNALRAKYCYHKDKDYVVRNGEIVIIDHNTGRLSEGRTWSSGLHQAIETKEGVPIKPETVTLGTISIQNFFRVYNSISGMSGTIVSSSDEFDQFYGVHTIAIPTNKKMVRQDHQDRVYLTLDAKYKGLISEIVTRHNKGQPILIGTTSVAESETISEMLEQNNIKHTVLNAKNNLKEAHIIAQAGQPYSVTVSTSMAGRGTDIILGGNKEAINTILEEQLDIVSQQRQFFKDLLNQAKDQFGSNMDVENISNTQPDDSLELLSFNEISFGLDKLNDTDFIAEKLNTNPRDLFMHLRIVEKSILNHAKTVEDNWTEWRQKVLSVGGLCVIGSSRNESRRIDNQLRGRAGRQGDPGESLFYLSFEDSWVKVFGDNALFKRMYSQLNSDDFISTPMITKAFAKAQSKIESFHFNARKDTFQYDSIANEGRQHFFKFRNTFLEGNNTIREVLKDTFLTKLKPVIHWDFTGFLETHLNKTIESPAQALSLVKLHSVAEVITWIDLFSKENPYSDLTDIQQKDLTSLEGFIDELINHLDENMLSDITAKSLAHLDELWQKYLAFIDESRQNVAFAALAQKNPHQEYRTICFEAFSTLIEKTSEYSINLCLSKLAELDTST